jgi:hypothetical protein
VQVSAEDGTFRFPSVPAGFYTLEVVHERYEPVIDTLAVDHGQALVLDVRFSRLGVPSEPVRITTRSQLLERVGFYERQRRNFGIFMDRAEIQRRNALSITDLLRTVAGVHVTYRSYGATLIGRRNCEFRYVLDGARVGLNFSPDELAIGWIAAIEIYQGPAQVPPEFVFLSGSERANCGVIAFWTRDGR